MKKLSFALLCVVVFVSCSWEFKKTDKPGKTAATDQQLQEMVDTDKAFSTASEKNGMKKAFLEFIADDAVLLRPGFLPIVEGDVIKFLNAQEDTSFTMTWEPRGADVASSGDMGFTYGVYKVATADTTLTGTYLNVWRKQEDGKWKFVIDTGNPGV
nr:nuclear transport factor 2 family protein [Lacibacter sp.]